MGGRQLSVCIPELHNSPVRVVRELECPNTVVTCLFDGIVDRLWIGQIDSLSDYRTFPMGRCIGLQEEFAELGLVAETLLHVLVIAYDFLLQTASVSPPTEHVYGRAYRSIPCYLVFHPKQMFIVPLEYDKANKRGRIWALRLVLEFGKDERVNRSTPAASAVHAIATLSFMVLICLNTGKLTDSNLQSMSLTISTSPPKTRDKSNAEAVAARQHFMA